MKTQTPITVALNLAIKEGRIPMPTTRVFDAQGGYGHLGGSDPYNYGPLWEWTYTWADGSKIEVDERNLAVASKEGKASEYFEEAMTQPLITPAEAGLTDTYWDYPPTLELLSTEVGQTALRNLKKYNDETTQKEETL